MKNKMSGKKSILTEILKMFRLACEIVSLRIQIAAFTRLNQQQQELLLKQRKNKCE